MKKKTVFLLVLTALLLAVLPVALAGGDEDDDDEIVINTSVKMNSSGGVTISWSGTDDGNYVVWYEYVNESADAAQTLIRAAETDEESVTLYSLIPGAQYRIEVSDEEGREGSALIRVPKRGTVSSKRKMSIKVIPKYRPDEWEDARTLKTKSASAMERNKEEGYQYGIDYQTTYYSSGKKVKHKALFALYAPNGYAWSCPGDFTLPYMDTRYVNVKTFYGFFGETFFEWLLEENGEIPVGTYKLEIYLEGRFYKSATFKVVD